MVGFFCQVSEGQVQASERLSRFDRDYRILTAHERYDNSMLLPPDAFPSFHSPTQSQLHVTRRFEQLFPHAPVYVAPASTSHLPVSVSAAPVVDTTQADLIAGLEDLIGTLDSSIQALAVYNTVDGAAAEAMGAAVGGVRDRRSHSGSGSTSASHDAVVALFSVAAEHRATHTTDGLMIVLHVVCASIRNARHPLIKLKALELLTGLAVHLPDDVRMERVVPYLLALLVDANPIVRTHAVHDLAHILGLVAHVTAADGHVFQDVIIPALSQLSKDPDEMVTASRVALVAAVVWVDRVWAMFLCVHRVYEVGD
jgi:hypothetical protein